jgi:hypothetical protein
MSAIRKLLFRLVREALENAGDDKIRSAIGNFKAYEELRSQGYIARCDDAPEDRLTRQALLEVFQSFEEIQCPPAVQKRLDELGVSGVRWRVAERFIHQNQAEPLACTIFIKNPWTSQLSSWFHEMGHVLFHLGEDGSCAEQRSGVSREKAARLAASAKLAYDIVASLATPPIPGEKCIQLAEGRAYGFTHHGPEGEDEELWAILFGEYCAWLELRPPVREIVEDIISDLTPRNSES